MKTLRISPIYLLPFIFFSGYFHLNLKHSFCYANTTNIGCKKVEKEALLRFKKGLEGPSGLLSSWTGENCCSWDCVTCDNKSGHVIKLNLQSDLDNQLVGEISPSLLELKYLSHLDLSMNDFGTTKVPSFFRSLTKLTYLNLSGATFGEGSDLKWVSSLTSLKYLDMGGIDLSKASSHWLQSVNMVPSLLELHLPLCQLLELPPSLPLINFTSLLVLDLSNNRFNSTIPGWLFNLTALVELDLSSNNLQGQLSGDLGKLCNFQSLKLSANNFSGEVIDFINGLSGCAKSTLEILDLGYNKLTGNLPDSLGYLNNLRYLELWSNSFTGSIPNSIGNLSYLEEFYLSENKMGGNIPESIGQLSSLVVLELSENSWEGIVTEAHFAKLAKLRELKMTKSSPNISVVFNISANWVSPFNLSFIKIRSCQLGPKFPNWLRNQIALKTIVLNNARISDNLPKWFGELDLVNELDIAYNNFSGKVPNNFRFSSAATVDLSSNRFEGPLPLWSSNVTALYLRDNLFYGHIPIYIGQVMPYLTDLDISLNSLNGSIPLSVGNLTSMTNLVISNNYLSGEIPDFWNDMNRLYLIDMSNNSLSGTIPRSMGSLPFLLFLMLSSNNLSGEIPFELKNCANMNSLDIGDNQLSGKIPTWIGENMASLLIFRARNNSFTGKLPRQICQLSALHILDLSKNSISGIIPSCLGNLSGFKTVDLDTERYEGQGLKLISKGRLLEYRASTLYLMNSLDLSSNNFSGNFPESLTTLVELRTLNLSINHLKGKIPDEIGNLKNIETLDLKNNRLSGHIPSSISDLTFLNSLNLSSNNLSGKIPTANQFQSLNDPSIYQGNSLLCGAPLEIKCADSSEMTPVGDKEETDNEGLFEDVWLIISIVVGFFVGFWGICGTLIVKKRWRDAFYNFLGEMTNKIVKCFGKFCVA